MSKPSPKMLTIRLDADKDFGLDADLKLLAWERHTSVNRLIIELLKRAVVEMKGGAPCQSSSADS